MARDTVVIANPIMLHDYGMAQKPIKRRKVKAMRKDDQVRVLVTESEKAEMVEAANRAGLAVASWLRSTGLQAARQGASREIKKGR